MIFDIDQEKVDLEKWLEMDADSTMSVEELVQMARTGIHTCPADAQCLSRKYCGEGLCRCVRSVFASPEHYSLYEQVRELVFCAELLKIVMEKNNADSNTEKSS